MDCPVDGPDMSCAAFSFLCSCRALSSPSSPAAATSLVRRGCERIPSSDRASRSRSRSTSSGSGIFLFSPTHPFLPYVAPHFSHISHCNLVFLGRSRACTRPSLSSSAAPPRSGEDRPTCSPGGKKAHSKYRTPALSSFLSLATFALERFSTLGACFSLSLRSSLSLSHMRRSPLERTMPTPLESSTPHCLSRRDSPSLK